eukprot:CAMPEP_0184858022 /NCGR_PEP_ID=MMETSP0580-20130426/3149_1 /TAXON_ID=1118495 /ORGANISM="Dactyliosolen fragilissimus" /LENGTH=378 /DNA_ID=CAMNT_0027353939 /DNA_START=118 /DNA_END=1254 /DNA_ORIENTATION=+
MPSKAALAAAAAQNQQKTTDDELIAKASKYVEKKVIKMFENSKFFSAAKVGEFPRFERKELTYGKVLGRGGFGIVNEIVSIKASSNIPDVKKTDKNLENREFISANFKRKGSGDARYVVKNLNFACKNDVGLYIQGIMDLAIETYILSGIDHPNIINMRAIRNGCIYHQDYFLILDRLYDTLEQRIVKWSKLGKKKKYANLIGEKLFCGSEISGAISYLHSHEIIYRDLKPENIGFDIDGDVKIFDFGLAKQLPPEEKFSDGTYSLTGETGSMRYMAPEVHKSQRYNFKCDMYSLGILLWEILAAEKPFKDYSTTMHKELVVGKGYRPKCDKAWPESVNDLMKLSWSEDHTKRPTSSEFHSKLRAEFDSACNKAAKKK